MNEESTKIFNTADIDGKNFGIIIEYCTVKEAIEFHIQEYKDKKIFIEKKLKVEDKELFTNVYRLLIAQYDIAIIQFENLLKMKNIEELQNKNN